MTTLPRLVVLGTGSAFPSRSYNECFIIETEEGRLLVDAGGGNGIINILESMAIDIATLHDMFVTHSHTDHILGAVWVVRRIVQLALEDRYEGCLTVYGNADVIDALRQICRLTFLKAYFEKMETTVDFRTVEPGDNARIAGCDVRFIDCHSANVAQTGFHMSFPEGPTFCCLGDEALTSENASEVAGADYLLCGAFCRYADRTVFRPYEKHHLTVKDVAATAQLCGIRNLILAHCEDRTPAALRQPLYAAEAAHYYNGNVLVPEDGATISLKPFKTK